VPLPLESALVIGGTSFEGFNAAVNTIVFDGPEGADGLLPHAAARIPAAAMIAYRFIVDVPQ